MQDTWGIPGPTFLVGYIVALIAVAVLAAVHRKILFRGDRGARLDDLGPQQIAYLNGGDRLAIYSSLGGLRAADALGSGPGHTLVQTGPIPSGRTALDSAVHHAAGQQVRTRDLAGDQWVRSALDDLRAGLERRGLANSQESIRTARIWAFAAGAVAVLGIFRLVAGVQHEKPVGYLVPLVLGAGFLTLILSRIKPIATNAAVRGLRDLKQQHDYLAPQLSPAYATYGAAGAAMGVALFGAASLYAMDPAFAAEAEIQRAVAGGLSGGGAGGSSCGSSSSCGGGGGCGGGGCGG